MMHRVAVLALPEVVLLDLAIPVQVFEQSLAGLRLLDPRSSAPPYSVQLCGKRPGLVSTNAGVPVVAQLGLDGLLGADTVVVPGTMDPLGVPDPEVSCALRASRDRGARLVSICVGAFVLAAAGVLDGLRATTHWMFTDALAERFPRVQVEPNVLYVDQGHVLTSAGVAAGIDLCLHLVRKDMGHALATRIARQIVAAPHRVGGQAQFVERPVPSVGSDGLGEVCTFIGENLAMPLSVGHLAARAGMSERTFARRFRAETGIPPAQWIRQRRIEHARELLEITGLPVEAIAARCGFGSALALRARFSQAVGVTPGQYRQAFRARPDRPAAHEWDPHALHGQRVTSAGPRPRRDRAVDLVPDSGSSEAPGGSRP
jgi:AraC family transcriptional regulator, transcriptional activator FtrA